MEDRSPFDELNSFSTNSNEDGVSIIDVDKSIEDKYKKKKRSCNLSLYLGFQWKWYLYTPVRWADNVGGFLWYHILRILQWITLHLSPKSFKTNRRYAHLFEYPSAEEGRKADTLRKRSSWLNPQRKPFVVIIDRIRRRFMFSEGQRFRVWKWIYFTILIIVALVFLYRYTSEQIEIHKYVTPDKMHERTGRRITNVVTMGRFALSRTYGAEQRWLLQECKGKAELTPQNLQWGYVDTESPLASMDRVNISVDDLVLKMKEDSRSLGATLPQPCLCGVHYGLPINVILLRPPPGEEREHVLYEPVIQRDTGTNIKGTISIDSLVVTTDRGIQVSGRTLPISPIDGLGMYLRTHGDIGERNMKEMFDSYSLPDNVFHDIVDLTSIGSDGVTPWLLKRSSIPIRDVKDDNTREVTVGYESFVVRGMNSDGSPAMAMTVYSPQSICVQRCLETLRFINLINK